MNELKCCDCEHSFRKHEHYVALPDGELCCEQCFWDRAINFYDAKERQIGYEEGEDE